LFSKIILYDTLQMRDIKQTPGGKIEMIQAFDRLAAALWRYGNSGQIPCSILLLVEDDKNWASTVGVLEINDPNTLAFLNRAKERGTLEVSSATFSREVEAAITDLIAELGRERQYTLLVMHPSPEVADIVICNGKRINGVDGETTSGYGSGLVALSTNKISDEITYVTPGSTAS
jgi:hypothetical protein